MNFRSKTIMTNKYLVNLLCIASLLTSMACSSAVYGQETMGELTTTMEIQNQMQGQEQPNRNPMAPKNKNQQKENVQGIEKLEKVAQKLLQSLQTGKYEQADFSAVWNGVIPPNTNFSDGLNATVKPVLDQYGKPQKLGQGKMAGNNRAVFPVQFATGTLNMIVSLDTQDKIQEWKLLPTDPAASNESPQNTGKTETQAITAEQPKEANAIDIKDFNSFQRELNRINIETRGEEEQWLSPQDKKVELARSIEELVISQLRFIRKLAESEHSEQTIKAVDLVIRQRQERLNKLITKLEDTSRQERQQKANEQRVQKRTQPGEQIQTERPMQRTPRPRREPNTPGQQY